MSNIFSGWFQINLIKNYKIFRRPFKIKENWFAKLYDKHYTKDLQVKFNPDLFVDQDRGKAEELLNEIKFNSSQISQYRNELRILSDWLDDFPKVYKELKDFLRGENITINANSKQYEQLELLLQRIPSIKAKIQEQKNILGNGTKSEETSLPKITFDHDYSIGFDVRRIDEYGEDLKFIKEIPSEIYPVAIVFRRQSEIINQIQTLNSLDSDFFNTLKIIHGKAGMGKSNISAYLTTSLKNENHPVIIVKAKSFDGNPDEFNRILMEQLLVPNNYTIEEVLKKINNYGKVLNKRVVIIFDGLNETTYANEGFSKIWEKSLDTFIEILKNYRFIYFVSTLRTSYISRIWDNNQIPYSNFELTGFNDNNLETVIKKYFDYYNIGYDQLVKGDIFYFKTPLLIDLYCQMLNPQKDIGVIAVFGLNGFKDVFERYISNLSDNVKRKLTLGTSDQIIEGIDRCSDAMLGNLEANIPKMSFYSLMQNQNVVKIGGTIGDEILSEYLIYLDENHKGKDVIVHTQQEVGGYLLAKELVRKHSSIDNVINSDFFKDSIIGDHDLLHQLKDDILKFLLIESNENSIVFEKYIDNPTVKNFTLITLETEKLNSKTSVLRQKLSGGLKTKEEINELLNGLYSTFFDLDSPLNFDFIKSQLILLESSVFEYTWSKFIYDNYYEIDSIASDIVEDILVFEQLLNKELYIDFLIWNFETTVRQLRDKIYVVLLNFFERHPNQIFEKVIEYSNFERPYIYERLMSLCYGICLINQNNVEFIQTTLKDNISKIYELQFGKNPKSPVYNYIVIDCIKHIVDLAIFKGVFTVNEDEFDNFNNYRFELDSWFDVDEQDEDKVRDIYLHWTMDDNPDPLRGDFVHYTIPRLEERDNENRLANTAHIYKHIINLGYHSNVEGLSQEDLKFRRGDSLYGVEDKIDRLGKKYSWISFFDYAGYLLNQGRLNVWREDDSEFEKSYDRLGDIEIEITNPKPLIYNVKLTDTDLFSHKDRTQDWVYKPMYDSVFDLLENGDFTLLSGFINQRETESYDSRSFLLINSFFVKKDTILGDIKNIFNREYDWREDVITSNSSLSKVYFGELYWADNIPPIVLNHSDLPTEEDVEIDHMVTPMDIFHYPEKYKEEDLNKFVKKIKKKRISFEYEPTLIDYLWESNSKIIPTISSTIPNINIGKQLDLRADVTRLQVLDNNNTLAHKSFEFEENYYAQNFEYFRTDLLIEYIEKNGYLLVYQIKQHTYDRNAGDRSGDFRGMQFFLSPLNN
ncbi:ATP-binding protein [Flavobacterium sp. NRK1]|uniref:ATP-binding protein n=1 Tax=Flavobacterium sp. NRK1 TaxID=2954929 RepID=UPI002093A9AB|nr:ATP-binding protein [Flavobacterium sp. NRK1]MCO6148946.1 ATP-binding protein [Flavobacterium sp. NRK1]